MKGLVSIIIPYRSDRGWLQEAIKSVEMQTSDNFELILSKGEKYRGGNLNDGIKKSRGEFIKPLDDDDLLLPNCVEKLLLYIRYHDMIHGNAHYTDGIHSVVYKPQIKNPTLKDMMKKNYISNPTVMYRRDIFDKVGYFDESLSRSEDYDMHLRILKYGIKIGYYDDILVWYRLHENQVSIGKNANSDVRKKLHNVIKKRL